MFYRGIARKVVPFFVNLTTLLQMFLAVIQGPLPIAQEANQ
jgi:hypothetical protein